MQSLLRASKVIDFCSAVPFVNNVTDSSIKNLFTAIVNNTLEVTDTAKWCNETDIADMKSAIKEYKETLAGNILSLTFYLSMSLSLL